MASSLTVLSAQPRNEFGKGASRRLRRAGRVPVVMYGLGQEPMHAHVDILELQAILRREGVNAVLELELEGEQHLVMVKAVDQNILTLNVDHADLLHVKRGEKVEVSVPVVIEGTPAAGTTVNHDLNEILIQADVLQIPEEIIISVEDMPFGAQIHAGDVELPAGCELVTEPDVLIVNIVEPHQQDDAEGEEPAEPEADNGGGASE